MAPQTEHQLDLYRRRTYGISSAEYDVEFEKHGRRCPICSQEPKTRALNIDHSHSMVKRKVTVTRSKAGIFFATVAGFNDIFEGAKAAVVRTLARVFLKRRSVRGIICGRCNRGLQFFGDCASKPTAVPIGNLRRAADYLERWSKTNEPQDSQPSDSGSASL